MSFMKNLEALATVTRTANGDLAYSTTLNKNLDLFGVGSSTNSNTFVDLFEKAYDEDRLLAIKNLFFTRDIRNGNGRRLNFREGLKKLAEIAPKDFIAILPFVSEIGRWDDIMDFVDHKEVGKEVVSLIKNQLEKDLKSKESISLLGKWMPKETSKNERTSYLAKYLANALYKGNKKLYRKNNATLKNKLNILEHNLTNKEYSFDYNHVPSKALLKYTNAFERNDKIRYTQFKENVEKDKFSLEKLGKKALKVYPHEFVTTVIQNQYYNNDKVNLANLMWSSLPKEFTDKKILVVRDGSESMIRRLPNKMKGSVSDVATALTLYTAERLTGEFKDSFITFSRRPKFVKIPKRCDTLSQKVWELQKYDDALNTDIEKTYDLIYEASLIAKPEDRPDMILVVSDMQFDSGADGNKSTFEVMRKKFESSGLKFPKYVYWNLNVSGEPTFTTRDEDVLLVSGFSTNLLKTLLHGEDYKTNLDLMHEILSRYNYLDEVLNKVGD